MLTVVRDAHRTPPPPPADDDAPEASDLDAIVVTATAGGKSRLRSSVSTSRVNPEAIERSAPRSTAEIFRNSYLNAETIRLDGGIRMPPK